MTAEPMRVVPTSPASFPADWMTTPAWCVVCEVHMATNREPTCPVCTSIAAEEAEK
jgi:1,6-anhydro-N-acetylmuramate kinase